MCCHQMVFSWLPKSHDGKSPLARVDQSIEHSDGKVRQLSDAWTLQQKGLYSAWLQVFEGFPLFSKAGILKAAGVNVEIRTAPSFLYFIIMHVKQEAKEELKGGGPTADLQQGLLVQSNSVQMFSTQVNLVTC